MPLAPAPSSRDSHLGCKDGFNPKMPFSVNHAMHHDATDRHYLEVEAKAMTFLSLHRHCTYYV